MAEYRKVATSLWSSPDFQALGTPPVCPSVLWMYLLTSPAMRIIPGVLRAGPAHIAEEIDPTMETWAPRDVVRLLDQLEERDLLRWDRSSRVIWLVKALGRAENSANDNQIKGWRSAFDDLPRSCPFLGDLWVSMVEAAGVKAGLLGDVPDSAGDHSESLSEPFRKDSSTASNSVSVTTTVAVDRDPNLPGADEDVGEALSLLPEEPKETKPSLTRYVEAWNAGLDDAEEDLGKSTGVSRGRPERPPGALKAATKVYRDPDEWRWCAYALATSAKATADDAWDGYGLRWVAELSKARLRSHMEEGADAKDRGRRHLSNKPFGAAVGAFEMYRPGCLDEVPQ